MRKNFLAFLLVVLVVICFSTNIFATRTIYIDPCHGGSDWGFDFYQGKLEKNMNLDLAFKITQNLDTTYYMTRTADTENREGSQKLAKISEVNPDLVVGLHHHGKNAVFIEYNEAAKTLAYQLGAYFISDNIDTRFIKYQGVWLFDMPQPVIVLIVTDKIVQTTDWSVIAQILQGLD